jgi:hypothetical protein
VDGKTERQMDRQMGIHKERLMDIEKYRQTNEWIERQTDGQTDEYTQRD